MDFLKEKKYVKKPEMTVARQFFSKDYDKTWKKFKEHFTIVVSINKGKKSYWIHVEDIGCTEMGTYASLADNDWVVLLLRSKTVMLFTDSEFKALFREPHVKG